MAAAIVFLAAPGAWCQTGGTIKTIAGNNTAGYTGDGAGATSAQLDLPFGVAFGNGTLYIADQVNNRVRSVSGGNINAYAGTGTSGWSGDGSKAVNATLTTPLGLALDSSGNLYIADAGNNMIRKVTGANISSVAGNGAQAGYGGDGAGATGAYLNKPAAVVVDSSGNLYIADTGNNAIRKVISSTGIISTYAGSNGTAGFTGQNVPATKATLNSPQALALDSAGNLYVADTNNNAIRKITAAGLITTFAGNGNAGFSGDGTLATLATLSHPRGIAVDTAGNVYISDTFNNRIRVVTPNGIINTIAGSGQGYYGDGGLAVNAEFSNPAGIFIDSSNNMYVADNNNQVIRQFPISLSTGGAKPAISSGGVITAGNFGAFAAISPGSWIEIYGSNLGADTRTWGNSDFTGSNAPTSLDGTTVTIGGINAYVDFVSPLQVNAQVPAGIGTGPQPVIVSTASGSSAASTVQVNLTEPGLYAPPSFKVGGKQYVGAVFSDGATFVMPPGSVSGLTSRQAHAGETITIYGVGFGTTTNGGPGQITQSANNLTAPFQVLFGSTAATVTYYGLAPSAVGLYQFNVIVPNVAASDAVPITFLLSGVAAPQTLYTAVQ